MNAADLQDVRELFVTTINGMVGDLNRLVEGGSKNATAALDVFSPLFREVGIYRKEFPGVPLEGEAWDWYQDTVLLHFSMVDPERKNPLEANLAETIRRLVLIPDLTDRAQGWLDRYAAFAKLPTRELVEAHRQQSAARERANNLKRFANSISVGEKYKAANAALQDLNRKVESLERTESSRKCMTVEMAREVIEILDQIPAGLWLDPESAVMQLRAVHERNARWIVGAAAPANVATAPAPMGISDDRPRHLKGTNRLGGRAAVAAKQLANAGAE